MQNNPILLGGLLFLCGGLSAQQPTNTGANSAEVQRRSLDPVVQRAMDINRDPENGPYVPLAEAEWAHTINRSIPGTTTTIPIPAAPKENQQYVSPGTVSVHTLRNPLSSKGRKLIQKAGEQIEHRDYEAAAKTLESAMKLDDARPYALAMSASIELGQYIRTTDPRMLSGALAALLEAVPQIPEDVSARSNLGLAYYYSGDFEHALEESMKALQMDPTRVKTRYVMGLILTDQHRYTEAIFHLKMAAPEIAAASELLERVEVLAAQNPTVAQK